MVSQTTKRGDLHGGEKIEIAIIRFVTKSIKKYETRHDTRYQDTEPQDTRGDFNQGLWG